MRREVDAGDFPIRGWSMKKSDLPNEAFLNEE
jgi:hypothetical protein